MEFLDRSTFWELVDTLPGSGGWSSNESKMVFTQAAIGMQVAGFEPEAIVYTLRLLYKASLRDLEKCERGK